MADSEIVELWSRVFLSEEDDMTPTCSVNKDAWSALMNRFEGCKRIFAMISFQNKTVYVPLGSYTDSFSTASEHTQLILPGWALDIISAEGTGEAGTVTWLTEEAFPSATRIVIRPHDSAFYHSDAKEELEGGLTQIGVIQKGQAIMIPIQTLGGYPMSFDIVETEPANTVLADGEEVIIEFEASLDMPPEPIERPATPHPPVDLAEFTTLIEMPKPPVGRTTGGVNRYTADGKPWNPHRG
jgi:hypothetical protein